MTHPTVKIDIVSDVVCPWCAVGYQHLNQALNNLSGQLVAELTWHPFELNPQMGQEGQNIDEHIAEKYGLNEEQLQQNKQRLIQAGNAADYRFNFDARSKIFNTFQCHILLQWALTQHKQKELKLAFMHAYFTEGKNISDVAVLLEIVKEVGLDPQQASLALKNETIRNQVRDEQSKYMRMGIQSVPSFILNDKYLISGGQPVEVFEQALKDIAAEG